MNLKEWLFRNNTKITDFARQVEVDRTHINLIVLGKKTPSPKLAAKIEKATNGEVSLRELLFPEEYKEKE